MSPGPAVPGFTIADLTIGPEIGRGAYSVVHRCTRHGRDYAVKVALGSLAHDAATLRSFRREAMLLASLDHPNVVAVHQAGEADGRPYLVMDLVQGSTLDTRLAGGALDTAAAARIGLDIADALSQAHRRGLVHRDVKPQNIVVGPTGAATLIDFGLTARTGGRTGTAVAGTVLYSAPEQLGLLNQPVDARSDLYCLGVVLYECLTGVVPYRGTTAAEVMHQHATAHPAPLATVRPDLPDPLPRIVGQLLAKDPDDRYQSAAELADDLARVVGAAGRPRRGTGAAATVDGRSVSAGRDAELAQLFRTWNDCRAGLRGVATVSGPAGSGKSHLISTFLAAVADDVGVVARAKCSPDEIVPLAALRDALHDHLASLASLDAPARRLAEDRLRSAAGSDAGLLAQLHPRLAQVLGTAASPGGGRMSEIQFRAAIVRFLGALARAAGGLVLWVDDVQWLGHADRQVLADLAGEPDRAPVLLVGTSRDRSLNLAAGAGLHTDIGLGPLDDYGVHGLVVGYLGGIPDDHFVQDVTARSAGSPLAVVEYLRAVIDAGLIRPSWGHYVVDRSGLDSLDLPAEVLALILRRVEAISAAAEPVLAAAAALGSPFDVTLLPVLLDTTPGRVQAAVAEAEAKQLVRSNGAGQWAFLHDRIREALLSTLSGAQRRAAHRRAAEVLDAAGAAGDARLYQLAHHSVLGGLAAGRRFQITAAAAAKALAELASAEALAHFQAATEAATEAGIEPDSAFEEAFGVACTRASRTEDSLAHFWRALHRTGDTHRRARILAAIADVEFGMRRYDAAAQHVDLGLATAGHALPGNPLVLLLTTVFRLIAGVLCRWPWTGFGTATGQESELYRTRARLHVVGARTEFMRRQMARTVAHHLWALYPVQRLGRGVEYVTLHTALAPLWAEAGQARAAHRILDRVTALAADSGNPTLVAEVEMYAGVTLELTGEVREAGVRLERALAQGARWMDVSQYQICAGLLVDNLLRRGYWQRAWDVLNPAPGTPAAKWALPDLELQRARIGRSLGHQTHATFDIEEGVEPARRSYIYRDLVELAVEAADFGPELDAAIAGGDAEGVNPTRAPLFLRPYWLAKAKGRLEQARLATPADRPERLRLARAALQQARAAVSVPLLRADLQVLLSAHHELHGHGARALRCLATAESLLMDRDAPRVRFDILVQRARCLRAMQRIEPARQEALLAMALAGHSGWVARERAVRREFSLDRTSMDASASRSAAAGRVHDSRRLDALLAVSAAAGGELDPLRVASIALDKVIEILGADRVLLLLADDEPAAGAGRTAALKLYAGRDADGNDVRELSGYASTLVERARTTGEALVVAGTRQGAALGSQSAVQNDLRSILVATIPAGTGRDGVIYLDSQVAKGMFVEDDVELVVAIAKQVIVSMQSARSAWLRALVEAERRDGRLAAAIGAMTAAPDTGLDPADVPGRVLLATRPVVPFDAGWALAAEPAGGLRVLATCGAVDADARGLDVAAPRLADLRPALAGQVLAGATDLQLPGAHDPVRSWLAVPVVIRSRTVCVLVFASGAAATYGDSRRVLAATLVQQAAVTFEEAWLFRETNRFTNADVLARRAGRRGPSAAIEDKPADGPRSGVPGPQRPGPGRAG